MSSSDHAATPLGVIDFRTEPARYHHWQLELDGHVAWLGLAVNEQATIGTGYELKLNSYDLGVDIELHDAVQRLRFEHPEVGCVVVHSKNERVFCAGANIKMLGRASHGHKVNFCKFTNETRNGIEDATHNSGQFYLAAVKGSCAGGGYELALACDEIVMADDGASAVSLPELPLLAVLPGTGGLTRLVDKRHVRRDRADFFCTVEEGIRGKRAVEWDLVDAVVPSSSFEQEVRARATAHAAQSDRPGHASGVALTPLTRHIEADSIEYSHLSISIDRELRAATFTLKAPATPVPTAMDAILAEGARFWPLAIMRDIDDAILHLRFNEEEIGTWIFKSEGDAQSVLAADEVLENNADHWFIREVLLFTRRVLKRIDVSARSLIAAVEPGSCFAGTLLEFVLAADQSYMLSGQFEGDEAPPAALTLNAFNFGRYPMVTGITRIESRFQNNDAGIAALQANIGTPLIAARADELGLVTFTPDDIDWQDELRIVIEARAGFSPDALTGMEASLRFPGPETMESKIFSRLSAWQNWIFQRPNAVGENGALVLYGTGKRPQFHKRRV
jgi:benzoyl-CoA-dihydrodiol lyase